MPVGKVRFYDAEKGFGFLTGSSPNLARWRSPVHGAPGRVRCHRAGHDGEWLFRVTPLLTWRRDQRGQGYHRRRRVIEDGSALRSPSSRLGVGRCNRQRWSLGRLKVGRALDRRILRPVLPGCHAVIVDAGRAGPEFADARRAATSKGTPADDVLSRRGGSRFGVGLHDRNGYA